MESFLGILLGTLNLFYPLLICSIVIFIYGVVIRSWPAVLISGLLIFPDVWFFSGYPSYAWVILFPFIHLFITYRFYKNKQIKTN